VITFNIGGQNVRPHQIGDALMRAAVENIKDQLHERLATIRHPKTGEFPVVLVTGDTLDDIFARVQGSSDILSLVRQRAAPQDLPRMEFVEMKQPLLPKAFLSFAWENHTLVSGTVSKVGAVIQVSVAPGEGAEMAASQGATVP
jgi:hypothetical protein